MTRRRSVVLGLLVLSVAADPTFAENLTDCINARIEQRKAGRAELVRETSVCQGDRQCLAQAQTKWRATEQQIENTSSACRARAQSQAPRPPDIHWKYGDPSPVAPDGRRYIMSCSGKVLGMYKPGGAVEMEMKTHPGNCFPNDHPWLLPQPGAASVKDRNYCYERTTGAHKEYSGSKPDWCQ